MQITPFDDTVRVNQTSRREGGDNDGDDNLSRDIHCASLIPYFGRQVSLGGEFPSNFSFDEDAIISNTIESLSFKKL